MSLPLTRRIAKTVLLTAAGAASVVGTAGAASAAELPTTADVGGLSNLDHGVGHVDDTASEGAQALTPMSSSSPLSTKSVPDAGVKADTSDRHGDTSTGAHVATKKAQLPDVQKSTPQAPTTRGLLPTDQLQGTPGQATPAQKTPAQGTPAQGTPAQAAPGNPAQGSPLTGLSDRTLLPKGLGFVGFGGR
jgi:hypothetical protein